MKKERTYYSFGKTNLPLLVTFPRSGTNWIRYIIEYFSDKPTPGETRLKRGHNYIIDRAHNAKDLINNYNKVILCLRDYKEIFGKHILRFYNEDILTTPQELLNKYWRKDQNVLINDYFNNIIAFDKFKSDKILLYYEDILFNPKNLKSLLDFLDIYDENKFNKFKNNFNNLKKKSSNLRSDKNKTTKDNDNIKYYSSNFSDEKLKILDDFIKSKYPIISEKYLERYQL
ncbi:MAG: hypothetical protein ACOC1O_00785 [bacterium]